MQRLASWPRRLQQHAPSHAPVLAGMVVVAAIAVATRFVGLRDAPAEWYGDISTLYEYVVALRNRDVPAGYYNLGVGPLYPMLLRPFVAVFGTSYLSVKAAGALWSLVGLGVLFGLARRIRSAAFGLLTVVVASVSSWWLVYSRLGDVQALTPTLTIAVVYGTVLAVRSPGSDLAAVATGMLAGLGLYLYGNTFVLPAVVVVPAVVAWRQRRITWRVPLLAFAAVVVVALPLVGQLIRHTDAVVHGHAGTRFVGWSRVVPDGFDGIVASLRAYLGRGDVNFRGNPIGTSHVDRLSAVLGVVGIVWWLTPGRRRMGVFLLGTFVLLHVPVSIAERAAIPSVSRTVAAAPLAYLFVASGVAAVATLLRRVRHGQVAGTVVAAALVAAIAGINLDRYVHDYLPGLPYDNTPVAGAIVDVVDDLPDEVTVHLIGVGWEEWGVPESKSVRYQLADPARLVETDPAGFDCEALALLARPTLLVWSHHDRLPTPAVGRCADAFDEAVLHQHDGRPVFRAVLLP